MAGPGGGVQPFVVPLASLTSFPGGLRAGQTFQALVQGQAGNLSVVVGGTRVPVGDIPQLTPGQVVNGEIVRAAAGLQIRLSPQPVTTPQDAAAAASLPQVLARVLESLSALGAAEDAARVVHPSMPANEAAVRSVLSLFLSDARTGAELELLEGLLSGAAQTGALTQQLADRFGLLVSTFVLAGERDWRAVLEQWRRGGRTLEGRLALAAQSGRLDEILAEASDDLRGLLMRVRHDAAIARYLRGQGRLRDFQETADRVLDRLAGAALQNLRNLEQPYFFVEVPFLEDTGLERLQLHFMSGRGAAGKRFDPRNAMVAIDVSLSQLGDLWIVLRIAAGECSCVVRAASAESLDVLRGEKAGLVESLAAAGYPGAQVRFGLWEGDRLRELGQFMRQYAGVDVRA